MLRLRFSPDALNDQLGANDAAARLMETDAPALAPFVAALPGEALRDARASGATEVELYVEGAGEIHDAMAAEHGFELRREIHRMGRELPVDEPWDLDVRPFRPGEDDDAWLEVNNRAFHWHPDQGGWTAADLAARLAEPWIDVAGFLVHERDGRLAGFCWTKIHADERPPFGEIFVVAVDPDFHGAGLGRPLVLAGLDWLARQGLREAILYVEATNEPAIAVYESLGFAVTATNRWWQRHLVS
jgi:mycothiol synthase